MIIKNEKDRLVAMRMLEDAKFPLEFRMFAVALDAGHVYRDRELTQCIHGESSIPQYYSDETSNLGAHHSGYEESE